MDIFPVKCPYMAFNQNYGNYMDRASFSFNFIEIFPDDDEQGTIAQTDGDSISQRREDGEGGVFANLYTFKIDFDLAYNSFKLPIYCSFRYSIGFIHGLRN